MKEQGKFEEILDRFIRKLHPYSNSRRRIITLVVLSILLVITIIEGPIPSPVRIFAFLLAFVILIFMAMAVP